MTPTNKTGDTMATGPYTIYTNPSGAPLGKYKWWFRSGRDVYGNLVLENNPFIYTTAKVTDAPPWYAPLGGDGLAYYYYDPAGAVNFCAPGLYAKAYDRFSDKVWGDAQMLLAVDVAERGQTLVMLQGSLNRLAKAATLVKRRRFTAAMKALRATPPGKDFSPSKEFFANWMALRYGWTPTVMSIYSFCEVLAKPISGKAGYRVSASAKQSYRHLEMDRFPPYGPRWLNEWDARVRISGFVAISDPRLASLNQYGLVNPLSVAWELVTRSFVVGWFLPIGDILADLTRFVGLSFTQASVSYSVKGVDTLYLYGSPPPVVTSVLKQRSPFSSAPPTPHRLMVGNGLNPKRCLDALALLTGALRR